MRLTAAQRSVANNKEDSILLLAGAGTGKTAALAERIARLLKAGIPSSQILCLSFTNRACRELSERIAALAQIDARGVTVRTMHSFCADFLRSLPVGLHDLPAGFAVCDQEDALEIIRDVVCAALGRPLSPAPAATLQGFISLLKERLLAAPEESHKQAAAWLFSNRQEALSRLCYDRENRCTDEKFLAFLQKYGGSFACAYDRRLLSSGLLDFSDLLLRAGALLRQPEIAALSVARYRYLHVDEAQDISLAEYELIRRLGAGARLLLCGDFHQTIYEWRGSDPTALIARFRADFSPVEIAFTRSFRACEPLLDTARNFRAHALGAETPSNFDPLTAQDAAVQYKQLLTPADEAGWIIERLHELVLPDLSKAAIIVRTNRACAELCELLSASVEAAGNGPTGAPARGGVCSAPPPEGAASERTRAGVPPLRFMLADETRLFSRPQVRDLSAVLALHANPLDSASLSRVLARLTPGAGPATRDALASGLREGVGARACDLLDERTRRTGDFFAPLTQALDTGRVVVFDVESTGTDVYTDEIIQIAAVRLASDGSESARLERFLRPTRPVGESEQVHGFSDAFLSKRGDDPARVLEEFLHFVGGCVIVGHNVRYDITITTQNLLRLGSTHVFTPVFYDTLDLARRYLPTLPNHKLLTISEALKTSHTPSHDAMDDILATADVLCMLHTRYILPQTEQRRTFYEKHLPKLAGLYDRLRTLGAAVPFDLPALCRKAADLFQVWKECDSPAATNAVELFISLSGTVCDRSLLIFRQLEQLLELSRLSPAELARLSPLFSKISVITAHQSKGCEFDVVFLPMLQEGVCPLPARQHKDVLEEARVFYVSLTRAKQRIYLSWSEESLQHRKMHPSRFLSMLSPGHRSELPPKDPTNAP